MFLKLNSKSIFIKGDQYMNRCDWCKGSDLYMRYHDEEWGVPVHEDMKHFEFLVLESMQSGLSWLTILRKRENFRKAFDDFKNGLIPDGTLINTVKLTYTP